MNFLEATIVLLLIASVASPIATLLKLPVEIFLVIGSLLLSLIPGAPHYGIDPAIVFLVFLPPILFSAAYFTSWRDFRANLRSVSLLAIGLVLFSASIVAFVMRQAIPGMSWSYAFLLGAIVAPPDASAATSIIRQLNIPRRVVTILEGESLVNDATALIAYQFALAAVLTGEFSAGQAGIQFVLLGAGGIGVGLCVAFFGFQLLRRLNDARAEVLLTFLTAFSCYIVAEKIGVSGVIATVSGGIYFGRKVPVLASGWTRLEARPTWEVVLYVINGAIFTLIGMQLSGVLHSLQNYSTARLGKLALILTCTVIGVRFVWIFATAYLARLTRKRAHTPKDPSRSWKALIILSWTGMRGIVSLTAALALPRALPSGQPLADRDLLIFLTYSVILITLILPSLSLPFLLKALKVREEKEPEQEELKARDQVNQAVLERISIWESQEEYPPDLIRSLRERFERRLRTQKSQKGHEAKKVREMLRQTIDTEREALLRLRNENSIHDEIFHQISLEIDLEEARLHERSRETRSKAS